MAGGFVSFALFYKDYVDYFLVEYVQIGEKMVSKCGAEGLIELNIWPNEYKLSGEFVLKDIFWWRELLTHYNNDL